MAHDPFKTQIIVAEGTNADIDTAEEDIVVVTDRLGSLKVNKLSIYFETTLGTNTSVDYRFYCQNEKDGSWFKIPQHNLSTNAVEDYKLSATSAVLNFVFSIELESAFGFKVTGQGVGGANSASTVKILGRYI